MWPNRWRKYRNTDNGKSGAQLCHNLRKYVHNLYKFKWRSSFLKCFSRHERDVLPPVTRKTWILGALKSSDESESNPAGIIAHWSEILMWCLVFKGWSGRCPQQRYPITFQIVVIWMQSTALHCTICVCVCVVIAVLCVISNKVMMDFGVQPSLRKMDWI